MTIMTTFNSRSESNSSYEVINCKMSPEYIIITCIGRLSIVTFHKILSYKGCYQFFHTYTIPSADMSATNLFLTPGTTKSKLSKRYWWSRGLTLNSLFWGYDDMCSVTPAVSSR